MHRHILIGQAVLFKVNLIPFSLYKDSAINFRTPPTQHPRLNGVHKSVQNNLILSIWF